MPGSPERCDVRPAALEGQADSDNMARGREGIPLLGWSRTVCGWSAMSNHRSPENALSWVGCWPRGQRWLVEAGRRGEQVPLAEGDLEGQTDPAPDPALAIPVASLTLSVLIRKMEITNPSWGGAGCATEQARKWR